MIIYIGFALSVLGLLITIATIVYRFGGTTSALSTTLGHLSKAIEKLEGKIDNLAEYGKELAGHQARIESLDERVKRIEDREDRDIQ